MKSGLVEKVRELNRVIQDAETVGAELLAEIGAIDCGDEVFNEFRRAVSALIVRVCQDKVNSVFGSLSFSETEAAEAVFGELGYRDGLVVAGKIADRTGISRSVINNTLRKLESAGVIETRSLGVKGTHVEIKADSGPLKIKLK